MSAAISLLASLFRPESNDACPTILLGAGASFSSQIPMAAECVRRITKRVYAERILSGGVSPERVKPSEWQTWLRSQEWFVAGSDNLAENFPHVVENLLRPQAYRRSVLLDLIEPIGPIGEGYHSLANLVMRGLASTVMTTNFDPCLPRAFAQKHPHIRQFSEVNRGPSDYNEFDLFGRAQIVWLHGKAEQYTDRNLIGETDKLEDELIGRLAPLLDSTPLIVVGYRGAENSIMSSLLDGAGARLFRKGVFWCRMKSEALHPNAIALKERIGQNFHEIEIDGFDQLFGGLDAELANEKRFHEPNDLASDTPFDEQVCDGATWGDVDRDLALSVLNTYCAKLSLPELKSDGLRKLMLDLGLLIPGNPHEQISNGAILLFGRNPQRFFPHAVITTTVDMKRRRVFSGNLIFQRKELLEWLDDENINPALKVKGKHSHQEKRAYADRALVEVLMNMIVHRDYEISLPSSINVTEKIKIDFVNPGEVPTATGRLVMDDGGVFDPIPEFSHLRNRSLCDIFFGMSAMERAGTGLVDIAELSRSNSGDAQFAFPPGTERFEATLYRPGSSAGSDVVAKSTAPIGTYTVNMMVLSGLPESVQVLQIAGGWEALNKHVDLSEAGPFVFDKKSGRLWSFAASAVLSLLFEPVLSAKIMERPLEETKVDADFQRRVSWLIRNHFERYLQEFEPQGLILERDSRGRPAKRAYFTGLNEGNRPISYDTPKRKGISRDVAKRREHNGKIWFECEGFGYEVIMTSGAWGIRIKPFYMFTKRDGVSPLPGYLRTKKSTWRFKFDRNANVDSDLVFWERLLSQGQTVVNLGRPYADDLLLEGSFFTAEIEEKGLLDDDVASENRRTA